MKILKRLFWVIAFFVSAIIVVPLFFPALILFGEDKADQMCDLTIGRIIDKMKY